MENLVVNYFPIQILLLMCRVFQKKHWRAEIKRMEQNGDAPSQYYGNWANADQGMFVYDASFIKFRQIIFGYNFPAKMFHNKIQGIRLSFVTRNVFTIMKHTPNIDPEASYSASIYSQGLESQKCLIQEIMD